MVTMETKALVTVICPAFNEEVTIEPFYERLKGVLAAHDDRYRWEILFTDNASLDGTASVLSQVAAADVRVKTLRFTRNFGYQAALIGGLTHSSGDAVVIIDVDCEDPPELISTFLREWENGFDVVYGIRQGRPESKAMVWSRKLFYRLNKMVADSEIILDMAEFGLFARPVVNAVLANRSTFPFIRSEIAFVGFSRKGIPYDRGVRIAGKTHYRLWGLIKFAIAGILASTTFPLRVAAYLCFPILAAAVILAVIHMFQFALLLELSYVVFFTAMLCLYLARTYKNGVARPLYLVDWSKSIGWPREQNRRSAGGK